MPNATENQILIPVPFLQGGGSASGDGVPKIHPFHPLGFLTALVAGDVTMGAVGGLV